MELFTHADFDGHELVGFASDPATGLRAIIAVHSTRRGPAAGGCRLWRYESEAEALRDALRLSRGMSLKNAVAGLDLGGGKAVIMLAPGQAKTPELMRAFGRAVDRLNGLYITAEDVGVTTADMVEVSRETAHVAGLPDGAFASGDPSPVTARGVFEAMQIGAASVFGGGLDGRRVAVQGLGHVGWHLCRMLHHAGARLIVTDIDDDRSQAAARDFGAEVRPVAGFHATDCDILAPCALGAVLSAATIPDIRARLIAGAANNQLETEADAERLHANGIAYMPDFLINAGGISNVAAEIARRPAAEFVEDWFPRFRDQVGEVMAQAAARDVSPQAVAQEIAAARLGLG
ncbi:MAG: Glu/Leu/Phe/Val dehydrogenase dimerization domain-containing protein [Paracoccus sp. (in: a-proteobacteria)]|uniref:Glu/Leu/Phe/Val family dehydrogenase n=1 Tax=Paracoccus sp. TaxID=267 RepID=UPI0026E015B5|nr:Glu/Leu/Phe/Val dehydrogenase dimerization domain-containing protein [Paracoccus sp. (in: a-proteobacteria)]MDO5613396.1 Glu/Leu/Phe/Val dehydrogenase dimerization domain-containing protein [Paracoccus sp. (in: a-proteobacteria)]